jgi:hypothetical protein
VAQQLGVPEGTLSGRLTRGRALLAKRLARHGLAVSGGALGVVLSQNVLQAGVPTSAGSSTIHAASAVAAGHAAAGAISAEVAALTEGVMRTTVLMKPKITGLLVILLAAALGGAGLIYGAQAGETTKQSVRPTQGQADERPNGGGRAEARTSWGRHPAGQRSIELHNQQGDDLRHRAA